MKVYHIYQKQFLPVSQEEAWDFFSRPMNLVKITPPNMDFNILHISGNGRPMYQGQIISYKIRLLKFINMRWLTEITHVNEPNYFVDDQRFGPYALWHHQHTFKPVEGGVEMTDEISYAIPYGIIGRIVNYLFVENELKRIFKFRYEVIEKTFTSSSKKTQLA